MSNKTPLHAWHQSRNANMADFGGYEMPLWYDSVKKEHLAVLTHAGLFDTSHMAVVRLTGAGAHNLLQRCFSNNLDACIGKKDPRPLRTGRCVYGAFLNESGGVIDDSIVYKISDTQYLAVVNAGMGQTVASHLRGHSGPYDVAIADLTGLTGKIDIQGPLSARILADILADPDAVFTALPYFAFKGHLGTGDLPAVYLKNGTPILLSRSGYTGEFGFELFMAADQVVAAWEAIVAAGFPSGLVACGLAARDSLRGGAVLPLSHQDIGPWPFIHNPWTFALPWAADGQRFTKSFIGDTALLAVKNPKYTLVFAGNDLRKVSIDDPAVVLNREGDEIGRVLTCVSDMGIGYAQGKIFSVASPDKPAGFNPRGLCCGFIRVSTPLNPGDRVRLKDHRRAIDVTIVNDIRPDRTARKAMREMI
ncbi:MAG: aminomethyl transferase family protein [Deltaproteobacteria bacterium]|nr:MAG: aminomethyl transferase family protein [Deltaproteobacteria bacterium]